MADVGSMPQIGTTGDSTTPLGCSRRPPGSTGDTESQSLRGQWHRPCGRDLSWMSGGLDPVAGLSAGSCLVSKASVSLGLQTHGATKSTGNGVQFEDKRHTLT